MISREISLDQLRAVDWGGVFDELRTSEINLYWTPIRELSCLVLNTLAPRGHVLWDFGPFRAFQLAHARARDAILAAPSTKNVARRVAGSGPARPEFSEFLIGGLTRYFGDEFLGVCTLRQHHLTARRQESYLVSELRRESVQAYFASQSEWANCVREVGDDCLLVVTDESRKRAKDWYPMLGKPGLQMSPSEIREANRHLGRALDDGLPRDLDITFGYPGDISISLPIPVRDEVLLRCFTELATTRVRTAVEVSALSVIERLSLDLDSVGWRTSSISEHRNHIRELLAKRLVPIDVINSDPFGD